MEILERHFNETKTKKEFKQMLWIYDFWGRITESKAAKTVLNIANIKDGSNILEVACGTGELLKHIIKLNPNGKNTGIDLSPDMLDKANKKLNKSGNKNSDNSFDYLINNYMVDLLPAEYFEKIASEFYRLLKPNGVVVISTFSFGTKRIHRFWFWVAKRFPGLLTGCRPVKFKNYLINAGFEIENDIEISQNTFPSQIIKAKK